MCVKIFCSSDSVIAEVGAIFPETGQWCKYNQISVISPSPSFKLDEFLVLFIVSFKG